VCGEKEVQQPMYS